MRSQIAVALFVAVFAASAFAAEPKWKTIEHFIHDWDSFTKVSFTLEIPEGASDPGDFTRIRIRVPGHREFQLANKDAWVKIQSEDQPVPARLIRHNLLKSPWALLYRVAPKRSLLFLIGYAYASSPGSLDVIALSDDGSPTLLLHRDELGLEDLVDLDNDGVDELVTNPCLSQQWGDGLLTYDPLHIYKIDGGRAMLSVPLSRDYNLKHYYGWAGPKCSEALAVVLHPPGGGRPRIMKSTDAEKLMKSSK